MSIVCCTTETYCDVAYTCIEGSGILTIKSQWWCGLWSRKILAAALLAPSIRVVGVITASQHIYQTLSNSCGSTITTTVSNMSSKREMAEKEEASLKSSNEELKNFEEEVARLRDENTRLRDCLMFLESTVHEKEEYYFKLVWFARSTNPLHYVPNFFKDMKKKLGKKKYEKFVQDIDSLRSSEDGNWHHGFNSGCLAMARLAMGLAAISGPRVWEDLDLDVDCDSDGEPLEEPEPYVESVESQRNEVIGQFPSLDS